MMGMKDLTRDINRHIANGSSLRVVGLPLCSIAQSQVVKQTGSEIDARIEIIEQEWVHYYIAILYLKIVETRLIHRMTGRSQFHGRSPQSHFRNG